MTRINQGWIYREPAIGETPARIIVEWNKRLYPNSTGRYFEDNKFGAEQTVNYISEVIGDSWVLEDLEFLGWRIVTELT